jgi:hypothetical protein
VLSDVETAAGNLALKIQALNASTSREIEVAFATLARRRSDALFVGPDGFFNSRRVQLALLPRVMRFQPPSRYVNMRTPAD